ncbi:hypothetical protein O3M35_003232 [Rhynocoris fuscipes]|uniref:ALMS motif domain-containing protein n=1 Tax=Rhynocoris fuscipes TaxID=488301 RepID=A0AAW1CJF7_9HEMI
MITLNYLKKRYDVMLSTGESENRNNFKEPRHKEIEEARKANKSRTKLYKAKEPIEPPKTLLQRLIDFSNRYTTSTPKQNEEEEPAQFQQLEPEPKTFFYSNIARKVLPVSGRTSSLDAIHSVKKEDAKTEEEEVNRPKSSVKTTRQEPVNKELEQKSINYEKKVRSTPFRGPWPELRLIKADSVMNLNIGDNTKDVSSPAVNRLQVKRESSISKLKALGERTLLAVKERKERNDRISAIARMNQRQAKIAELRARAEAALNRSKIKYPYYQNY